MTKSNYRLYDGAKPYFDLVRRALGDMVEGEHFFDIVAPDVIYEVRYDLGWPRFINGRTDLMAAFKGYCESCQGPEGRGAAKGSAITNDSFLALVSDQALRTIVIAGRPELGAPDWRGNVPGKPMSEQDVTDVVTWLASRRVQNPGQPYFVSNLEQH